MARSRPWGSGARRASGPAGPQEAAEAFHGGGTQGLGETSQLGARGVQQHGTSRPGGATRVRHGQVALEVAGADRALGAGRGSARFSRDRGRGARLRPLESPVDGQPLAVLPGLALAGGKWRKALGARGDAVALAVGEHLGTDLLFGVWCAAHGLNDAPGSIIVSTYLDNRYNVCYRK